MEVFWLAKSKHHQAQENEAEWMPFTCYNISVLHTKLRITEHLLPFVEFSINGKKSSVNILLNISLMIE